MRPTVLLSVLLALVACADPDRPGPRIVFLGEHYEALMFWRAARASGDLPAGVTLVHFDAHEDMGIPEEGDLELTVSNFIVPALGEGIFRSVVWVAPPWLGEIPRREKRAGFDFVIASLLDLPEVDGPVALDIDLDFFACENPHRAHRDEAITGEEYERLLAAGEVRFEGILEGDGRRTESTVLKRPKGGFTWPVRLDRVTDLETGGVRYVRGFICMGEYDDEFPEWRPTEGEWRGLLMKVGAALSKSGLHPSVITVARSAESGFVPAGQVDDIEEAVGEMLLRVYPGLRLRVGSP